MNLFIIFGPSGSGKDTIMEMLGKRGLNMIRPVTTTSREMRRGESQKKPYFFISEEEFKQKIENGEFVEWAWVYNDYKGTTKKELDRVLQSGKIVIWQLDYQGALSAKKLFPNAIIIFIKSGSFEELRERMIDRGDGEKKFFEREEYTKQYFQHENEYDYIVVNRQGELEKAIHEVEQIIQTEIEKNKHSL